METKLFEVRDRGTTIPAIGIKMGSVNQAEKYLAYRAGYGDTTMQQSKYILFGRLDMEEPLHYDPFKQKKFLGGTLIRTMFEAHLYVQEHWKELTSGDVIDIEFIKGEQPTKKLSERLEV